MSDQQPPSGSGNNDAEGRPRHPEAVGAGSAAADAPPLQPHQPIGPPPPRRHPTANSNSNSNNQAMLRQQASAAGVGAVGMGGAISSASAVGGYGYGATASAYRSPYRRAAAQINNHASNNNNGNNFRNIRIDRPREANPSNNPERSVEAGGNNSTSSSDDATTVWSEVDPVGGGIAPSARSLHSAALLNGVMYVFGGYDGTQRVNSFHAYSFAEKRWSPVLPSATSGPPPSPRDRHTSVAFANSFYVHGGFDGTARDSSLFSFDFSTMAWREVVATHGRAPSARHSHAAVVHDHSMYIFGGYDGSYKSDLHQFDFSSSRWSAVPAAGRRPRARYRATCVVHKNLMILYGGHDGTRHLSDTFVFDFDTNAWSSLITQGVPPASRDSHVSVVNSNSMYVFGGSSGSAMNDLYELQLVSTAVNPADNESAAARWRQVTTSRADQPRHRFCHVAVAYNDSMYVFGGYDGSDRLNSFIRFDFSVYDLSFEIPPATIIGDFRSLVNSETLSDITFVVEGRSVYAHKLMLMRCSYFEALFLGQMRESTMDRIPIEQVQYDTFLSVLEYLYTDELTINFVDAMELFEAADLFCIHRLKTMCEKRMLQSITVENAAGIFNAADMYSATALREKTKKYMLSHWDDVSKSGSFEEMGRCNIELVFELLKSR